MCRCGRRMAAGIFTGSYKFSAGRHPRHAAVNDIIKRGVQCAGILSILESVGVDRGEGTSPNGIPVFPLSNGRSLC